MSPWTDIPDFTVGQVLTSSRMNEMRDNANIGHVACTSSTRPASPDTGTMIYETDTGKAYLWNGSAWKQVAVDGAAYRGTTVPLFYVDSPASTSALTYSVYFATYASRNAEAQDDNYYASTMLLLEVAA